MEWYVLNYDFNGKKVEDFNIFRNIKLLRFLDEARENFITFDKFVEDLDREFRYCFWSKAEYEIMVGDLFEQDLDKYEKIDVYRQLKPNVKTIAKYIVDYWNA